MDAHPASGPPVAERHVTVNQVVAYNMGVFRRAAGITQEELGERLGGWSVPSVSAAERSWDGKRTKKFDADEISAIARILGIPLVALFLPPDEDVSARYLIETPQAPGECADMGDFMASAVMPDNDNDTKVMGVYRERWNAAAGRYLSADPHWAPLVARWLGDAGAAVRRADRAARLRERREQLLAAADELGALASALDSTQASELTAAEEDAP